MKNLKMLTIAMGMAATNTFFAQDKKGERPSQEKMFEKLDVNEDGLLVKEELDEARNSQKLLENFDAIDTDKNGMLSLEEFKTARKSRPKKND